MRPRGGAIGGERVRTMSRMALLAVFAAALAAPARGGIVSPRGGGPYPQAYRDLRERSRDAFTLRHAWSERRDLQRAGDPRFRAFAPSAASPLLAPERALSGILRIPVVLGQYSDITEPPVTPNAIDQELFTGPWTPGTLRQYWNEVSYDLFDVAGSVYGWVPLPQTELYYTGGVYQGITPGYARTGDMIRDILVRLDPTVDFGAFDNDGPDNVPNSGDDDGYVDVLLVVHPTYGAECNNSQHMWSHSWRYSAWPVSGGEPYPTNDAAAGGGEILIDDYIIVPSLSCETGQIEIGVICHELGHAIGLPDLYDYNGGGSGIGFWGLMGAGNWNTPASPAHLEAWSREYLGWINPVEIDWRARSLSLDPVETSGDAVKIPLPTRRFARGMRAGDNPALVCGYPLWEAEGREWPGGEGYGNGWRESMVRDFSVDASRPVTATFDVSIDAEDGYDFGMLVLERGGIADTLARYTGRYSLRPTIDLGARLPAGACDFTLRFLFTSDVSYSDEDGYYDSRGGYTFTIDNLSVAGGGLAYSTGFDLDAGGWRFDGEPAEYFLVENRRRSGFDANLRGQGLLVWHAENSIAETYLGNSGGSSNTQCRGLVLEEADGRFDLLTGGNYGDASDPFPGTTNNRSFGPTTSPRSYGNGGRATPVVVSEIAGGTSATSATFAGGMPAPTIASVTPPTIDKETAVAADLDIRGSWFLCGASCALTRGADTIHAATMDWMGEERILAAFPLDELYAGSWDLVVRSGDGQVASLPGGLQIVSVISSASASVERDNILVTWTLDGRDGIRGCLLFRSDDGGAFEPLFADTLTSADGAFAYRDYAVAPGVDYAYRIVTYLDGGIEEPYVLTGPYRIGAYPFTVDQNYPNPFNAGTTLSFFVPAAALVSIDIYDVSGKRIDGFDPRTYPRGSHAVPWSPSDRGIAAGLYLCVIRSGGVEKTIKILYVP